MVRTSDLLSLLGNLASLIELGSNLALLYKTNGINRHCQRHNSGHLKVAATQNANRGRGENGVEVNHTYSLESIGSVGDLLGRLGLSVGKVASVVGRSKESRGGKSSSGGKSGRGGGDGREHGDERDGYRR